MAEAQVSNRVLATHVQVQPSPQQTQETKQHQQASQQTTINDSINELFWHFLRQGGDSEPILKFIALAHRVADGTLVDYLHRNPGGEYEVFAFLPTTCNQDISHVVFDATADPSGHAGLSAIYCWAYLPSDTSKEFVETMFDLLHRSGGVTLSGAVEICYGSNAYAMAFASREPFWVDCLLATPELNPGWNVRCNAKNISEGVDASIFPLLSGLRRGLSPDATMAQIVPHTNDDILNASIPATPRRVTALNYAITGRYFETLYALLLRPNLDMNPPKSHQSVRETIYRFLAVNGCENGQIEIARVFDRAQLVFAHLPALINDILYHAYGLVLSVPLCNIIAQYYRMPYPILSTKAQIWADANPTIHPLLVPLQDDE